MRRFTLAAELAALAAAAVWAEGTAEINPAASGPPSGELVLYTSQQPAMAQETVVAFSARYPQIHVKRTRNGTSQLMNILSAEIMA